MPGHRVFIENRVTGLPPLIRVNSQHVSRNERVKVSREDLSDMLERERILKDQIESQNRQIHSLKTQLHAANANLYQAGVEKQHLVQENYGLRRSLESSSDTEGRQANKMKELRHKNTRLETDNESLRTRIRELGRQVGQAVDERIRALSAEISRWRRRYEDLDRRHKDLDRRHERLRENLDSYAAENANLRLDLQDANRRLQRHGLS